MAVMSASKARANKAAAADSKSAGKKPAQQKKPIVQQEVNPLWSNLAAGGMQRGTVPGSASGSTPGSSTITGAGPAANAIPANRTTLAQVGHKSNAIVQRMCAECTEEQAEQNEGLKIQHEIKPGTFPDPEDGEADAGDGAIQAIQMWDCHDDKPTCTIQAKCVACEAEQESIQQSAAKTTGTKTTGKSAAGIQHTASLGLANATQPLPHGERIQASFGRHDVSSVRTEVGGAAGRASARMGALAYTSSDQIAFGQAPSLRLAAHEAAHTIQQRSGLKLPGNVGRRGDRWEQHADKVADAVVAGESAEPLLDQVAPAAGNSSPAKGDGLSGAVQRQITSVASRHIEPLPVSSSAVSGSTGTVASEGGSGADAAPAAAEEESGGEENSSEENTVEEATPESSCEAAESDDEGQEQTPAPAQQPDTPAEEQPVGPMQIGRCYNAAAEAPPDDTPEPSQDAEPNQVEEQSTVTFPDWEEPNDHCECEVGEELQQAAGQGSGELVSSSQISENTSQQQTGGDTVGSGDTAGDSGGAAASAGGSSAGQSADSGSDAQGSFTSGEAQRDMAIEDYYSATDELEHLPTRAAQLSQGLYFANTEQGSAADSVRRVNALSEIRSFMQASAAQINEAVTFAQSEVPARLGAMAEDSKFEIDLAIAEQKAVISERIASARAASSSNAAITREQILSIYESSVATVNTETDTAIETLDSAYNTSTQAIGTREETALGEVSSRFTTARDNHNQRGTEYSNAAIRTGQVHVDAYQSCKGDFSDDGFWTGCLTVRRAHAQQEAACKTASGFAKNMLETAQRKGFNLREQRTQYRCAVISGASQSMSTLDTIIERLTSGLESGRAGTLSGLAQVRDLNLQAVDGALTATLQNLDHQEHSQRQAVNDSGYIQQVAIEQLAHQVAAGLARGISSAMVSLETTLRQLREQLIKGDAPEPDELDAKLAVAEEALNAGMGSLLEKMTEGVSSAEAQLEQAGFNAVDSLIEISSGNNSMTASGERQFAGQMSTLAGAANTAMGQLTERQVQKAQETAARGTDSMQQLVSGFEGATTQIYAAADKAILKSMSELVKDLDNMAAKLDGKIVSEAWKAAAKEQPAWKSVVAIVLIILVIIASIVISVLTLGAGAPFLAVVLVGAIVGAITAGLIQVINNWASGEEWDKGLVQAMVIGAVGGALGGAIGAGANGIAQAAVQGAVRAGASTAARMAINVGINLAGDMVAEGLSQSFAYAAYGQRFNWQGFAMAGGMSMASSARAGPGGAGGTRGADISAPATPRANTGAVRGAVGDLAIGMGLAGAVELLDVAMGGKFDASRFASSAASGAAGARAASRGAGGAPATPRAAPTTRLGRARSRVSGARDAAFGRMAIPENSRVSRGTQRVLGGVENLSARTTTALRGRGNSAVNGVPGRTPDVTPTSDITPTRVPDSADAPASRPVDSSDSQSTRTTTDSDGPSVRRDESVAQADSRTREISRMNADSDLAAPGASRPLDLGDGSHVVAAKRTSTGEVVLTSCSNCAILRDRLLTLADSLPPGPAKDRANALAQEAVELQQRINSKEVADIAGETRALADRVSEAARSHPDLNWTLRNHLEGVDVNPRVPVAPEPGGRIGASTKHDFTSQTGGVSRSGWFEPDNAFSVTARKNPNRNLDTAWEWYDRARTTTKRPALGAFSDVKTAVAKRASQREASSDVSTAPPELYRLNSPQKDWQHQVNDAWLAGHIEKGGVFEVVTNPLSPSQMETRLRSGDRVQSVFGRELQVLERHGYRFVQDGGPKNTQSTHGLKGRMVPPSEVASLPSQGYEWIPYQTPEGQFEGVMGRWVRTETSE